MCWFFCWVDYLAELITGHVSQGSRCLFLHSLSALEFQPLIINGKLAPISYVEIITLRKTTAFDFRSLSATTKQQPPIEPAYFN
jgi:hypothetical protein